MTKTKTKRNPKINPRITQMFLVLMSACPGARRDEREQDALAAFIKWV